MQLQPARCSLLCILQTTCRHVGFRSQTCAHNRLGFDQIGGHVGAQQRSIRFFRGPELLCDFAPTLAQSAAEACSEILTSGCPAAHYCNGNWQQLAIAIQDVQAFTRNPSTYASRVRAHTHTHTHIPAQHVSARDFPTYVLKHHLAVNLGKAMHTRLSQSLPDKTLQGRQSHCSGVPDHA